VVFVTFFFAACQTRGRVESALYPFTLMDEKTQIYFLIPVQEHKDAAITFSKTIFQESTDKEREQIVSHISKVYGGYSSAANSDGFSINASSKPQFVVTGSFPRIVLNSVFTKKNGWIEVSAKTKTQISFYRNAQANIEVFTGIPNVLIISDNVLPMIERLAVQTMPGSKQSLPSWVGYAASEHAETDVKFLVEGAAVLIEKMYHVRLPLDGAVSNAAVEGALSKNPSDDGYFLSLDIDLKDERAVRPAMLLLSFAGLFSGAEMSQGTGAHVLIRNVPMQKEAIMSLLL
jgi:hypothetical protein